MPSNPGFDAAMETQVAYLKEIRDSLQKGERRAELSTSVGMPGAHGPHDFAYSAGASSFASTQAFTDRILSGNWMSGNWSKGYAHLHQSSLLNDMLGAMGALRAPQTMAQSEFQQLSAQTLSSRLSTLPMGILAPGFTRNVRGLSADIFQLAPRVFPAGGPLSGPFGAGMDYSTATTLARGISTRALSDPRLTVSDYGEVARLGMASGQYMGVNSTGEFLAKTNELAKATGELARVMRMSVSDVASAMGSLRQLGVTGAGAQQGALTRLQASAQVAGITGGEMLGFASQTGTSSLGMGMGFLPGAELGARQLAVATQAQRRGVLSNNLVAQGGGLQSISANITNAQLRYASGLGGMLAGIGGPGAGGSFGAMSRGMGSVGGIDGLVALSSRQSDILGSLTGDQASALFDTNIRTQLTMLGVKEPGERAVNYAALLARSAGMEGPAALAYAKSTFSPEGIRAASLARLSIAGAARRSGASTTADELFYASHPMSQAHRVLASMGVALAKAGDYVAAPFGEGLSSGAFGLLPGGLSRLTAEMQAGVSSGTLTADDAARAAFLRGGGQVAATMGEDIGPTSLRYAGAVGAGLLAAGVTQSMSPNAQTAALLTPSVGVAAGIGTSLTLGYMGVSGTRVLKGIPAQSYLAFQQVAQGARTVEMARARGIIEANVPSAAKAQIDQAFNQLLRFNGKTLDASQSIAAQDAASTISGATGTSMQDTMNALATYGIAIQPTRAVASSNFGNAGGNVDLYGSRGMGGFLGWGERKINIDPHELISHRDSLIGAARGDKLSLATVSRDLGDEGVRLVNRMVSEKSVNAFADDLNTTGGSLAQVKVAGLYGDAIDATMQGIDKLRTSAGAVTPGLSRAQSDLRNLQTGGRQAGLIDTMRGNGDLRDFMRGQGGIFSDLAKLASDGGSYLNMGAGQAAAAFHVSPDNWEKWRGAAKKQGLNESQFRESVGAGLLSQGAGTAESTAAADVAAAARDLRATITALVH